MKVIFKDGRVLEVDNWRYINPTDSCDSVWAVSLPFGNFSETFVIRARDHEVVSVLLDSKYAGRITVGKDDIATSTDDFLLGKGYTREQIAALKKDHDDFNSAISAYSDDESLHSYFENSCDYAFDSDLNVWYHSDLIMRDCVSLVEVQDYPYELEAE